MWQLTNLLITALQKGWCFGGSLKGFLTMFRGSFKSFALKDWRSTTIFRILCSLGLPHLPFDIKCQVIECKFYLPPNYRWTSTLECFIKMRNSLDRIWWPMVSSHFISSPKLPTTSRHYLVSPTMPRVRTLHTARENGIRWRRDKGERWVEMLNKLRSLFSSAVERKWKKVNTI